MVGSSYPVGSGGGMAIFHREDSGDWIRKQFYIDDLYGYSDLNGEWIGIANRGSTVPMWRRTNGIYQFYQNLPILPDLVSSRCRQGLAKNINIDGNFLVVAGHECFQIYEWNSSSWTLILTEDWGHGSVHGQGCVPTLFNIQKRLCSFCTRFKRPQFNSYEFTKPVVSKW
eukprot:UN26288